LTKTWVTTVYVLFSVEGNHHKGSKMPRGATQTQSQSQSQAAKRTDLDDSQKDAAVANMVFYILCKEKGKPIHKKGELMKAVNLNGKRKDDQDEVLDRVKQNLEDVFGFVLLDLYEMTEADKNKNCFLLKNRLSHEAAEVNGGKFPQAGTAVNARGDKNSDGELTDDDETKREKAKTSLLNALLSLIFMSPGHTVKEETMDSFLIRLGVLKDHNTVGSDISPGIKNLFGVTTTNYDIKTLIKEEFGRRQQYIDVIETDSPEMDGSKSYEYKWGIRALTTVRRSVILKNVAAMYDVQPSDFKEQFDELIETDEGRYLAGGAEDEEDEGEEDEEMET